jgi:ADP-ribose pyrophosphatase
VVTERRISGETIFKGKIFTIERDTVDCGGHTSTREVVRHPGGVSVLAIDDSDRIVMVRQYRYAAGKVLLELPAGRLEPGEDPMAAGLRELSEETGYTASHAEPLGRIIPTGGYCSEVIWLYLASGLTEGAPHPDEGENVKTELVPFDEALRMIADGRIEDGKTCAGILKHNLTREAGR